MADGIKAIGGNPDSIKYCTRKKGDIKAFFELLIEQGGVLEKEQLQIGVVEGIVGIVHWEVMVDGFANHADTTPMDMWKDALLAAAKLIIAVNEVINSVPGNQVGTIGKITTMPGAYNVIPGKVSLSLEIRDLSYEKIWSLYRNIKMKAATIASGSGTTIGFQHQANESRPAKTEKMLQDKIAATAKALGYTFKFMQSDAGHDSQEMAWIAPVAMIFVPSVNGISHSPKEFTKTNDTTNGAKVLLNTILALDKE